MRAGLGLTPIGHVEYRILDLNVTATTAQVAGQIFSDLLGGGTGILLQEGRGGEDESGRAVRALKRAVVDESLLHGMEGTVIGQSLDRAQLLTFRKHRKEQARADGLTVDEDRA